MNLTTIYRGRRFAYSPILDRAIDQMLDHFGGRGKVPDECLIEFIGYCRQHGFPDGDGWKTWYEPCKVIKETAKYFVVESIELSKEIREELSELYDGGIFHVNKQILLTDGKVYHSRHGEYFYLQAPDDGVKLPEAKSLSLPSGS